MAGIPFKAGVEFRYIQMNQEYGEHGKLTFSSVENLAADAVKKAKLTGALPVNGLRKNDYFLYAQDEYKWRPNLTLNLGLRYTIFDLFDEKNGLAEPFDFATCGAQGFCGVGASFGHQNYGDVDPRVGFAWTPRKAGKDGDSRRIRHLPRRRTVGRSESSRQKRSAFLFGDRQFKSSPLSYPVVIRRPEPSHRMPNNGTAKTPMLSSGASRRSGSCRRTSWARSPTWEAMACICWKPTW